jgi:hypothetical protein
MKKTLGIISLLALGLLLTAPRAQAQTGAPTGTTTVSVTIGPQAGLTVTNSSTPLAASGSNFNLFTSITLKVTSDFSPTGGPSVASPLAPGDALTYTCTVASPGTACTGTQTASTSSQTNLASFGTNVHTGTGGSTASVGWSLANDPNYKTGTYNSTVTFTISAS